MQRSRIVRAMSGVSRAASIALVAVLFAVYAPATSAQQPTTPAKPDYQNASLPTAKRVDDLLARMTVEEKVAQMMCLWNAKKQFTDGKWKLDPAKPPEWFKVGIGRIERPSDGHGARAQAEFTNAIQKWVKENLGIESGQ